MADKIYNKVSKWKEAWDEEIARQKYLSEKVIGLISNCAKYEHQRIDEDYDFQMYMNNYKFVTAAIQDELKKQEYLESKIDDLKKKIGNPSRLDETYDIFTNLIQEKNQNLSKKIMKSANKDNLKKYEENAIKLEELRNDYYRLKKVSDASSKAKFELSEKSFILERKKERLEMVKKNRDTIMNKKEEMLKKKEDLLKELNELEQQDSTSFDDTDEDEDFNQFDI